MHAQDGGLKHPRNEVLSRRAHQPCQSIMAGLLTGLQQQLLIALVESGISKDALLEALDALYAKQEGFCSESATSNPATDTEQDAETPTTCNSDKQQSTSSKSSIGKIEESSKRLLIQDTRFEAEQQMNFLEHMLRYVNNLRIELFSVK